MASLRKPIKDESGITLTVTPDLRLFNGGLGGVMSTSMKLPPGQATYMASAITKDGAVAAALKVRPNVLAFILVYIILLVYHYSDLVILRCICEVCTSADDWALASPSYPNYPFRRPPALRRNAAQTQLYTRPE